MRSTKLDTRASVDAVYKSVSATIGKYLERGETAGERGLIASLAYQLALTSALRDSAFRPLPWFTACGLRDPIAAAQRVLAEVDVRRDTGRYEVDVRRDAGRYGEQWEES